MDWLASFVAANRPYIDAASAISALINIVGWLAGAVLLTIAWRRKAIQSFTVGPVNFHMQQEAIEATATAARDWQSKMPAHAIDLTRIRRTVGRAFQPEVIDNLTGKAVLWVDDRPINNELAVRALRKFRLDVVEATSTAAALDAMKRRHFDLVISDMGRGNDKHAGYELLDAVRHSGQMLPFLIFSRADQPEFRQEALDKGAQLSTNSVIELLDTVIELLGKKG
jgi:CheY-like chemotaxis protein